MRMTKYQREYLGCGDCVHFDACARWNPRRATEMQMCENFLPRCENCANGKSCAMNMTCECSVFKKKTKTRFFCGLAKVK